MTAYFGDPEECPQPTETLPLAKFLAEHRYFVYRVAVIGTSVSEVVHRLGGWIYDQSADGYHVTVITVDTAGAEALTIVGARGVSLAEVEAAGCATPQPHVLMVSTQLCRNNSSVRTAIGTIARARNTQTQVFLFGEDVAADKQPMVHRVEYPLGAATMAFKAHAAQLVDQDQSSSGAVEVYGEATTTLARILMSAESSRLLRDAGLAL